MAGWHLLADSGSTKTTWYLIKPDTQQYEVLNTLGLNPFLLKNIDWVAELKLLWTRKINRHAISTIRFFGAGCTAKAQQDVMREGLQTLCPEATSIEVYSDLYAAIYATTPTQKAIVGILGTGSNACTWNGNEIQTQLPSLGFILGDEGSGMAIGRALLQAYFYQQWPESLHQAFTQQYGLTRANLLEQVYQQPRPNRFLASFAPFAHKYQAQPAIQHILHTVFDTFIHTQLLPLGAQTHTVHLIGSVAYHFQKVLRARCSAANIHLGTILKGPFPALLTHYYPNLRHDQ